MGKRGRKPEPESGSPAQTPLAHETIRLDKWIWFARLLRTREACAMLVRKGHVRVNARKVNQPDVFIRPGDVLTLALPGRTVVWEVLAVAERREGAVQAADLYRVIEPSHRQT